MARSYRALLVVLLSALGLGAVLMAVGERLPSVAADKSPSRFKTSTPQAAQESLQYNYNRLRRSITTGRASLADARRAMTDSDPVSLSNSIHAFYTMRRHRGVVHLLNGMWEMNEQKYPELAWELIVKSPARIALASTLNRINIIGTDTQKKYIRSHKYHTHEFIRAQVAVALGFNGERTDLAYLQEMCEGENHYVAQSAITALSLFGGEQAKNVLIELSEKYHGSPRGALMLQMLRKAFDWSPPK